MEKKFNKSNSKLVKKKGDLSWRISALSVIISYYRITSNFMTADTAEKDIKRTEISEKEKSS